MPSPWKNSPRKSALQANTMQSSLSPLALSLDVPTMPLPPPLSLPSPSHIISSPCPIHTMGASLCRYPPVFTSDSKVLLVPSAQYIRVYSVSTGALTNILTGHTGDVTAVLTHPRHRLRAITASLDGTVREWDLHSGVCIKVHDLDVPIVNAVITNVHTSTGVASNGTLYVNANPRMRLRAKRVNQSSDTLRSHKIFSYNLTSQTKTLLFKARQCTGLALSPNNDYLACISGHVLTFFHTGSKVRTKCRHSHNLTSVAFHPSDPYIATGDNRGVIALWYKYETEAPVTSSLHWHSHAVQSLAFTHDGSYLLSGGEESVLVMWQMETGTKQFISRLLGALTSIVISANNLMYATSHSDNAIRVLNAVTSKISLTLQGSQLVHEMMVKSGEAALTPLVINSHRPGCLTVSGRPGYLQLYDVFTDTHLTDLDITQRNLISRTDDTALAHYRVERALYHSQHYDWLVTVERRTDAALIERQILRFWRYDQRSPNYALHTRIDSPHKEMIVDLAFHPTLPLLVTASNDRTFKLWQLHSNTDDSKSLAETMALAKSPGKGDSHSNSHWACVGSGYYRDFSLSHCQFNSDGSLLAVSYGQVLTLWAIKPFVSDREPASLTLLRTMLHSSPTLPIIALTFLPLSPSLIVTATSDTVYCWNTDSGELEWNYRCSVTAMAVHQASGLLALMTVRPTINDSDKDSEDSTKSLYDRYTSTLLFLQPSQSSQPFRAIPLTDVRLYHSDATNTFTANLCFVSVPSDRAQCEPCLVYINRRKHLVRIDGLFRDNFSDIVTSTSEGNKSSMAADEKAAVSLFERMYGKQTTAAASTSKDKSLTSTAVPAPTAASLSQSSSSPFASLFAAPSHLLPPMESLVMPFLESLLPLRRDDAVDTNTSNNDDNNRDESMQDANADSSTTVADSLNETILDDSELFAEITAFSQPNSDFFNKLVKAMREAVNADTDANNDSRDVVMNGHTEANGVDSGDDDDDTHRRTPLKKLKGESTSSVKASTAKKSRIATVANGHTGTKRNRAKPL